MSANGFNVYIGRRDGNIVYVGTTIQKPSARWRWHKHNGKNLNFELVKCCDTAGEMLDLELQLIKKHNPSMNKIKHRRQNLNTKLSHSDLNARKGDKQWCQRCLRRRVNKGYNKCYYC